MKNNRTVPETAMAFSIGEFELGNNGDNAKSAPITMKAISADPLEHWFWGRIVFSLAGMKRHKSRLPIDYVHDHKEVIGYLNKFSADKPEDGLVCQGALVPFKGEDRATEIIHKSKAGVPYEASIFWGGSGAKIEEIEPDEKTEVNGQEFTGPLTVVREWPLRGVAVCPYGADMNTESKLSEQKQFSVEVLRKESDMDKDEKDTESAELTEDQNQPEQADGNQLDVDAESKSDESAEDQSQDQDGSVDSAGSEEDPKKYAEGSTVDEQGSESDKKEDVEPSEGQRFLDAFGDRGGRWFAEGKSFEDAQELFMAELKAENDQLKAKVEKQELAISKLRGSDAPVELDEDPQATLDPKMAEIERKKQAALKTGTVTEAGATLGAIIGL